MDRSVRERGLYRFGEFALEPVHRVLTRHGVAVTLTPTVFDTLLHLLENPGRVVSKDELLAAVWPRRVVEEGNVSQTIFQLRRALSVAPGAEAMILTAPGVGYRFTPEVTFDAGASSAFAAATAMASGPAAVGPAIGPRRIRWMLAAASAVALAGGGLALWWMNSAPPARQGPPVKVVLADFQNLTGLKVFDKTLQRVAEIDLDQSPMVNAVSRKQIGDTLTLMARSPDEPVPLTVASDICERVNGGAVLSGAISPAPGAFLLTLTATDCSGERVLAAEKAQVNSPEAVIPALDTLLQQVRARLGESGASIARFSPPLRAARTASLPALQAYSQAMWLVDHGRGAESIPLFKEAIDADPGFALAHLGLSAVYNNANNFDLGAASLAKAYALRDTVGPRDRFHIIARYTEGVTNDLDAAIANYQAWADAYPRDDIPLANMSNLENFTGRYAEAVVAARRAFDLNPHKEASYVVLARALMHNGQIAAAATVCRNALAAGYAGEDLHGLITEIAALRGDQAGVARELTWAAGKPAERQILMFAGRAAYRLGQARRGEALYAQSSELFKRQGLTDYTLPFRARELEDLGLDAQAKVTLNAIGRSDDTDSDVMFDAAEFGDPARAGALIAASLAREPKDTLNNAVFVPEARAALDERRGEARRAAADLAPAARFEMRAFDTPYLRGRVLLAAGDAAGAEKAFRLIVDHPWIEPTSPLFPLARLELARAYRLAGDRAAARVQYEAVMALYKGADLDFPALKAAKAEYAAL